MEIINQRKKTLNNKRLLIKVNETEWGREGNARAAQGNSGGLVLGVETSQH